MKYSVLIATTLTDDAMAFLRDAKDIEVINTRPDAKQVQKNIANADALIIRDDLTIDAKLLGAAKRLKVIGRAGVGVAGLDGDTATGPRAVGGNTPDANPTAAGEGTP